MRVLEVFGVLTIVVESRFEGEIWRVLLYYK